MKTYSGDPYWLTSRFSGPSANNDGAPIRKGDRIFYYPRERKAFVGAEAEAASADFQSHAQDEAFMCGDNY